MKREYTTPGHIRIRENEDGTKQFVEPQVGRWRSFNDENISYDEESDVVKIASYPFNVGHRAVVSGPAIYRPELYRYEPVGFVRDPRTGFYTKPDHIYVDGIFWHKDDPNMPKPAPTWNKVGLNLCDHLALGCGTKLLTDFNFSVEDRGAILQMFKNELRPYSGRVTGIILVVLNPDQDDKYGSILVESGFVLLSAHTNYVHDHDNFLYGFRCMDHKPEPVVEKVRAFG